MKTSSVGNGFEADRFNLDNPEHAKAWAYLHDFDKDKVKSGNTAEDGENDDYSDINLDFIGG